MSQPPSLQNVAIDVDNQAIAILKYNRPQKGNSLNVPFLKVSFTIAANDLVSFSQASRCEMPHPSHHQIEVANGKP
jgi:hypothetical protein